MGDYSVFLAGSYKCLGVIRALVSPSKSVFLGTSCPMAAKGVLAEEFIVFVNDNVLYHSLFESAIQQWVECFGTIGGF